MFKKNVPEWERAARGVVGAVLAVAGVWWALSGEWVWGGLVAVSGVSLLGTALTGWCPMCAAVGRTLPEVDKKVAIARL